MPGSTNHKNVKDILEAKPLKFQIKTGNAKYECQIHPDRREYERIKASRANSNGSINTASTTSSTTQ